MGCGGSERDPALIIDTSVGGPESRAQLSALARGFAMLAALLQKTLDQGVNLEIIRSPETFAFLKSPKAVAVTPGTVEKLVKNEGKTPAVAYVRAETYAPGNAAHLILDTEKNRCTLARARVVKHSVAPEAKVLLEPNATLYADVTDSSGGAQATFFVTVTLLPLQGEDFVFAEGR